MLRIQRLLVFLLLSTAALTSAQSDGQTVHQLQDSSLKERGNRPGQRRHMNLTEEESAGRERLEERLAKSATTCIYNGVEYANGTTFRCGKDKEDCNTFTCRCVDGVATPFSQTLRLCYKIPKKTNATDVQQGCVHDGAEHPSGSIFPCRELPPSCCNTCECQCQDGEITYDWCTDRRCSPDDPCMTPDGNPDTSGGRVSWPPLNIYLITSLIGATRMNSI